MDDPQFFKRGEAVEKHGTKLPHWQQDEVCVFVTFRLADSLPESCLVELKRLKQEWMRYHGGSWSDEIERAWGREQAQRLHHWLDAGHGSCALGLPDVRQKVVETLLYGDGNAYRLLAAVIMPNHVHVLFAPRERKLSEIVQAWKSVSSRRIGEWCGWQRNYHDRLIRTQRHFDRVVEYVRANPHNLSEGEFWLYEGE